MCSVPTAEAQVYLASADWMPRNFYRRVEVMFPVESPELKERILHEIIPAYLLDNVKARALQSDGSYIRVQPAEGGDALSLPGAALGPASNSGRGRCSSEATEWVATA